MTYTYLKSSAVSAGSAVDLGGRVATFNFNNLTQADDIPSKDVGSSYNFRLAEVDYVGHANPIWTVEGFIPSGMTTNNEGSVMISFGLLGSYHMIGSPSTFYDSEFMLNPAGSTWVIPKSFKIEKDSGRSGRRYTLQLVETKQW